LVSGVGLTQPAGAQWLTKLGRYGTVGILLIGSVVKSHVLASLPCKELAKKLGPTGKMRHM